MHFPKRKRREAAHERDDNSRSNLAIRVDHPAPVAVERVCEWNAVDARPCRGRQPNDRRPTTSVDALLLVRDSLIYRLPAARSFSRFSLHLSLSRFCRSPRRTSVPLAGGTNDPAKSARSYSEESRHFSLRVLLCPRERIPTRSLEEGSRRPTTRRQSVSSSVVEVRHEYHRANAARNTKRVRCRGMPGTRGSLRLVRDHRPSPCSTRVSRYYPATAEGLAGTRTLPIAETEAECSSGGGGKDERVSGRTRRSGLLGRFLCLARGRVVDRICDSLIGRIGYLIPAIALDYSLSRREVVFVSAGIDRRNTVVSGVQGSTETRSHFKAADTDSAIII